MNWGTLPEFSDRYEISDSGQVRNVRTDKELKGTVNDDGYKQVTLTLNSGKQKTYLLHRLVANIFNPREDAKTLTINHKNHNKLDNNIDNLEWCTNENNVKDAWQNGLNNKQCQKVKCVETNEIFPSMRKACEAYDMRLYSLQRAIDHSNYTAKSKHWISWY